MKEQYFTVEQYMDRYAKEYGNFTYFSDWAGFNVPGKVISKFWNTFCRYFSKKEHELFYHIDRNVKEWYKDDNFYVIATYDKEDLAHELAHGYYYLLPEYANAVRDLYNKFKKKRSFNNALLRKGYSKPFLMDETQAYLATDNIQYLNEEYKIKITNEDCKPFRKLYKLIDNEQKRLKRGSKNKKS